MEIDKTTLEDLAIFGKEEKYSVFHLLNFTRTIGGGDKLGEIFRAPLTDYRKILDTQDTVKYIAAMLDKWPLEITNGTVMVMDKFFDTYNEPIPGIQGGLATLNQLYYRVFNSGDYSLIRYSLSHFITFFQTFNRLVERFNTPDAPVMLQALLERASLLLDREELQELSRATSGERLSVQKVLYFGHALKNRLNRAAIELMELYHHLDAWYSMAMAVKTFRFSFPEFLTDATPRLEIRGLYHPLLKEPVGYDVILNRETNFLFLTGANMAGKSTFIKAIGVAVFLAHIGMGTPAANMKLTFFDGILSNIQVADNIFLGESYFYNEVQRIKKTILKINDGRRWLILIDELFKGTNFQDAQNCSSIVIEGLIKMRGSLFVLSTHLYEIAEGLRKHPNISFKYFETFVDNEVPRYSYQLKEGISNDRLGFLILKREKVLDLLKQIKESAPE
ncbi:MAG TPA: DNA mismatch repair protein MutS [Chitinophagaceae bacterium]|nr:DNA mismatch repair protein MutS [Chitinophagaceae bacterium]